MKARLYINSIHWTDILIDSIKYQYYVAIYLQNRFKLYSSLPSSEEYKSTFPLFIFTFKGSVSSGEYRYDLTDIRS